MSFIYTVREARRLVLAWVRKSYEWRELVVYVDRASTNLEQVVQRWVPQERLAPVRSDPNTVFRYSWTRCPPGEPPART